MRMTTKLISATIACLFAAPLAIAQPAADVKTPDYRDRILTPPAPATPRINGPRVYGQRPGRPFLYTVPATGEEPITFRESGLPEGLALDPKLGRISGSVAKTGEFVVLITADNARGRDQQYLTIKIRDQI